MELHGEIRDDCDLDADAADVDGDAGGADGVGVEVVNSASVVQTLRSCARSVTVEPVLLMFMFGIGIGHPTALALLYKKVCLQQHHNNTELCSQFTNTNNSESENLVQSAASHWILFEHLSFEIPSILLAFFYASLSDHYSRKFCLLIPTVGQILCFGAFIIQSAYMELPVMYLLSGRVISGLFGGWVGCSTAAFSYLSDVSSTETRTVRIAIGEGCLHGGIAVAVLCSGILLDSTGFVCAFSIACGVNVLAALYIILFVPEPRRPPTGDVHSGMMRIVWLRTKQSVYCVFRRRTGRRKIYIFILLLVSLTGLISVYGMYTLGYIFVRRHPISMTQTTYSLIAGLRVTVSALVLFTVVPILFKKFHLNESTVLLIALVSSAGGELYLGFCVNSAMVFAIVILGCMSDAKSTCIRSLLSRFVDRSEYGSINAAYGILYAISGMIGTVLYNSIYPLTLDIWAGMCFAIGASFTVVPVILVSWLQFQLNRESLEFNRLEEEET